MQQREFLRGEIDLLPGTRDTAPDRVDLEIGHFHELALAQRTAPQDGADARHQFGEGERLDHVVVGAKFQALEAVGQLVAGGQAEHRGVLVAAQFAQHLPAVHAGQHHVEHDEVVVLLARMAQAVHAVTGEIGHET
ncbi:hypothetical protein D3C87_1236060 [compost metagenome]